MTVISVILLLISGILVAKYFLPQAGLLERTGTVLFFSIAAVPFININLALFGHKYASIQSILTLSLIAIIFFGVLLFMKKDETPSKREPRQAARDEVAVLILAAILAVAVSFYYSNKEFLLSLGSYFIKGDAECFYMQTFQTIGDFRLDFNRVGNNNAYEIICTPGNILFTSAFVPILKLWSFKALYVVFLFLLFIFAYLIVKELIGNSVIAVSSAFFASLNPYVLSVEVLDRNVMALAISAVFIYLVLAHKDKVFLHGLVFGIMAGTGLRFIPLLFGISLAILYYKQRLTLKNCLLFIAAFIITFTFNLPHLYFHGFHSLGETSPTWNLIKEAFSKWQRTPFLPFPNLLFYSANILNYFGYLVSSVILLGAFKCWKANKRFFFAFSFMFLSVIFILSYQRNWIEGDKYRIIISGFLPLYIFLGYGLKSIFIDKASIGKYAALCGCVLFLIAFAGIISKVDFKEDSDFYNRRFLYQKESFVYHKLVKQYLSNIGFMPNYRRLSYKLDFAGKIKEEKVVFNRLFSFSETAGLDKFRDFCGRRDKEAFFSLQKPGISSYRYIKIDFEKLASALESPVEELESTGLCAIDLEKEFLLSDVYYTALNVNWQNEVLPVTVILNKDEPGYFKELEVDLNAFVSFDQKTEVFKKIYPVNFAKKLPGQASMPDLGMESVPLYSENNTVIFRIPDGSRIVIRNWFINEKAGPYKIDSWRIKPDRFGNYKAEFFYNEPESYL